jgi:hypothetical protein
MNASEINPAFSLGCDFCFLSPSIFALLKQMTCLITIELALTIKTNEKRKKHSCIVSWYRNSWPAGQTIHGRAYIASTDLM